MEPPVFFFFFIRGRKEYSSFKPADFRSFSVAISCCRALANPPYLSPQVYTCSPPEKNQRGETTAEGDKGTGSASGTPFRKKKNPNKHQKCYISQEMHFHCCTQPTPFSCFTDLHLFEVVLQRRSIHKQGRIKIRQRFQGLPEQRRCVR